MRAMPSDRCNSMASTFTPLTSLASFAVRAAAPHPPAPSPPSLVKERPMMEAMEREHPPVMEEERPMMESVTAPAAPHDVLDRRNGLHCRGAPGRSDQRLGMIWHQESCRENRPQRHGSESEFTHLFPPWVPVAPFRAFQTFKIGRLTSQTRGQNQSCKSR